MRVISQNLPPESTLVEKVILRDSILCSLYSFSNFNYFFSGSNSQFVKISFYFMQVMTPNPECATVDTPIVDALHTMHDGKFLHLPVVDRGTTQ